MTKYSLSFRILALTLAASIVVAQTSVAPVGTQTVSPNAATVGTVAPVPVTLATGAPVSITPAPVPGTISTAPVTSITGVPTTGITATLAPVAPTIVIAPTVSPALTPTLVTNDYFDAAILKWSITLELGERFGSGNAVTPSPDGGLLYITRANGRLDVILASDGSPVFNFTPQPSVSGWAVTCSSGVYFGKVFAKEYAAYAVYDTPPSGSGFDFTSRIVVVSHPDNQAFSFTSPTVPGKIIGTPIITMGFRNAGLYILATHNTNTTSLTEPPTGYFSIFDFNTNGTVIWTEASNATNATDIAPYTALGVAHSPKFGKFTGGETNTNDIVVWTTSTQEGLGRDGYTRAFQLPFVFDPQFTSTLATVKLRDVRWNALARPTLSSDGQSLFAVVRESGVRGWVGDRDFQSGSSWTQTLSQNVVSETPITNAGTLSTNEAFLFVTTATTELDCLDVATGNVVWKSNSTSLFTSEPKVSPDDSRVFSLQADGTLQCHAQTNGSAIWSATCTNLNLSPCVNFVEAEFSISSDGLVVYYGDIAGNIKAIQVGTSKEPTAAPTNYPFFAAETSPPTMVTNPPVAVTAPPVAVTAPPVAVTAPPVMTTLAPVATTPAPVATTPAPVATTPAPVSTTLAPVSTTPSPMRNDTLAPEGSPSTLPSAIASGAASSPEPSGVTMAPTTAAVSKTPVLTEAPIKIDPSPAPSDVQTFKPTKTSSASIPIFSSLVGLFVLGMALLMN